MSLSPSLIDFVRPLYQDLDGRSRFDDAERVAAIARKLYSPVTAGEKREMEILLLLQGLGPWLRKVGNVSRTLLANPDAVTTAELERAGASLRRLHEPESAIERALAAALLIDQAGVFGLMHRLAQARREGSSPEEVVRMLLSGETTFPPWLPSGAVPMLRARIARRRELCRMIDEEEKLGDLR